MTEKNKKTKEKIPYTYEKDKCIDCNEDTVNYYKIPTNRGNIIKCRDCYELWVLRGSRSLVSCTANIKSDE
jgi:hypothetical protein